MWLEEALAKNLKEIICKCDNELMESLFREAKQMEREQIEDAYKDGRFDQFMYNNDIDPQHKLPSDYFAKKYGNGDNS